MKGERREVLVTAETSTQEENAQDKACVVGQHGSEGHSEDVPFQHNYEKQRQSNVDAVQGYGYPHGCLRVLHAYEPPFDGVEPQGGWCRPDAHEEVGQCEAQHIAAALKDIGYSQRYGPLQRYEQHGYGEGDGTGANQYLHGLVPSFGAESLGGEAAGAHAQESEVPVDEVEYLCADGYGAYVVARQMSHNGHVHHAEQRHGDVGHYVGQRQPQYAPIHQ